jgi:magnesium chelatase subunit D
VARAAAALTGQTQVDDAHTTLAARLVLAPRATQLPPAPAQDPPPNSGQDTSEPAPQEPPPGENTEAGDTPTDAPEDKPRDADQDKPEDAPSPEQALQEMVVQAALAAIPPGLLAALKAGEARAKGGQGGRSGAVQKNQLRGRPVGTRRSEPRAGARLHVLDTLRAAAPWQKLRQALQPLDASASQKRRIQVRREDFHVMRFKQNRPTTTLFVVDASGSSALHRLAEAKGAVELLLADCYVRRDRVAVLAFRGQIADLLLPPTRSLARAKRSLAALPGGGGTPLATGMDAARELATQIGRQGDTPVVVLLTDGRANIARDGTPGRAQAGADALNAAQLFKLAGLTALLIDTSPQPQAVAQALAQAMGAAYVPLPFAGAQGLSQAVRLASGPAASAR